ncbi:MAG: hypothetical protein AAB495_00255 [Patescibacteria group bacterium]
MEPEEEDKNLLYLPEDHGLLDWMDGKGKNVAPLPWEQQKIHIRATLRSRKTFKEFSKATTRVSIILVFLGLIQIIIMALQLFIAAESQESRALAWVSAVSFAVAIFMVLVAFRKITEEGEDKGAI